MSKQLIRLFTASAILALLGTSHSSSAFTNDPDTTGPYKVVMEMDP
jgi:hypothetical protein